MYRGIRQPYLHLMHDVMSLDGDTPPLPVPPGPHDAHTIPPSAPPPHRPPAAASNGGEQTSAGAGTGAGTSAGVGAAGGAARTQPTSTAAAAWRQGQRQRRRQPLLREWHRRGNPFRVLGDNSPTVGEKRSSSSINAGSSSGRGSGVAGDIRPPSSSSLSLAVAAAAGGSGRGGRRGGDGVIGGVGLGRLPPGTDLDDDPDEVAGGASVGAAAAAVGAVGRVGAGGRGHDGIQDELEAEEKR